MENVTSEQLLKTMGERLDYIVAEISYQTKRLALLAIEKRSLEREVEILTNGVQSGL